MTFVLASVDKTSTDYEVARKALEDMQEQRNSVAPAGEGLTPPETQPEPVITPQVELDEESEPPATPEVTPTGTVSPAPTDDTTSTPLP
jgi:hypothetical protein